MMRTSYDPEADAFYARFAPGGVPVDGTEEVAPGVMVDLDADGDVIGVEVLNVRLRGWKAAARLGDSLAAAK